MAKKSKKASDIPQAGERGLTKRSSAIRAALANGFRKPSKVLKQAKRNIEPTSG